MDRGLVDAEMSSKLTLGFFASRADSFDFIAGHSVIMHIA